MFPAWQRVTWRWNGWHEMLIRIDAAPRGPLAVIEELPNARLAMLEGLNGIGKTLSIRLLQLCTGILPYRLDSQAWASFSEGLGRFKVVITNLHGANEIVWVADSGDWITRPEREPTSDWFTEITIDGEPATLDHVRRLLVVHRLAGDEGIIDTFASLADSDAASVRRWSQRYAGPTDSPLAALEARAQESLELLGDISIPAYGKFEVEKRAAEDELKAAMAARDQAQSYRDESAGALGLYRRLQEIRRRQPTLIQELSNVDKRIDAVRRKREEVRQNLSALVAKQALAEPLQRELRNARRTLEGNRQKLTKALKEAAAKASALGLVAEEGPAEGAIEELTQRVDDLISEQTELDAAPAMRETLDQIAGELAGAEERGLGDQIAVHEPTIEVRLTVAQTLLGVETRRAYLEGQAPPPEAEKVQKLLVEARRALEAAHSLEEKLGEVARLRRLVARNEERVRRALQGEEGPDDAEARSLEDERRNTDEQLLDLAAKRAALAQQLGTSSGGATEEAVTRQLAEALESLGVTQAGLEEAADEAEQLAAEAHARLSKAQAHRAECERELSRAALEIRRAASVLQEREELAWLRQALEVPESAGLPESLELLLSPVEDARRLAEAVVDRLADFRTQLAAVERALQAIARGLKGHALGAEAYVEELQSWLSRKFSEWFNNPRVRRELLPKADGEVGVDLNRRQVTWREAAGERSRPLEAFSSGEQAFAYTRARLAMLDENASRSTNRLVVLDEFGAFIAYDRLEGLLAYLQDHAKDHANDQILIILPLSRDYTEMVESAVSSEAERFRSLAQQIAKRKYAVKVLVQ